uniref:Uncharacterized protein n=1 Tax=Hyaloperonospora arabidopsidis (strain Emoy2) TaxID=559515 RepID=M4B233_HYAAE
MKTWFSSGIKKGLKQLTVPMLNDENCFQSSKQLFDSLVKFCPRVEYVDGYKATLNDMNELTCGDTWLVTAEQWDEFNSTCTELREFHWVVVPFADPYFRVFGKHSKPRLTKLTLAVNTFWDWQAYFHFLEKATEPSVLSSRNEEDPVDEAAEFVASSSSYVYQQNFSQRPGYGAKASDVSSALKGCPALTVLEIALCHSGDIDETVYSDLYDDGDDAAEMGRVLLNIDIYNDEFCAAVAEYCPLLTSFSITEIDDGLRSHLTPIRTFTDQGLVALAKLKYLTTMLLRPINCTGNGVFEFLNSLSNEFVGHRTFQVYIGGHSSESKLAFYTALMELLMQLKVRSPAGLAWENRKFVLRLINSNFESVEPSWGEHYLRDLERAVTSVKTIHPTLRLRITTSGRRGFIFQRIMELGLYTANTEPSPWYGWDDEERNGNASFVNRYEDTAGLGTGLDRLPLELRHPELLDPDYELPADYFDDYGGYGDYGDYGDYDDYGAYGDDYFGEEYDGYYDGNADELWE